MFKQALAALPFRAVVSPYGEISSTRRTDTTARYILMRASPTLLSRRRDRSVIAVSQEDPFGLGDLEGDIPGSGGEAAAIVAAAIALPRLIAIIPGRLGQMFSEFKISCKGRFSATALYILVHY